MKNKMCLKYTGEYINNFDRVKAPEATEPKSQESEIQGSKQEQSGRKINY